MKAIPQEHNGILYRSRTEARWGEFWSLVGVKFEYEPEGFDLCGEWYVPDFFVEGIYFEIKPPKAPTGREEFVAEALAKDQDSIVVIASGNPGNARLRAYLPSGETSTAFIVEEFKREDGAWLAEFKDGGGWAVPLRKGLVNCAATGAEHQLLEVAGRLQFRKPILEQPRSGFESLEHAVSRVLHSVQIKRGEI